MHPHRNFSLAAGLALAVGLGACAPATMDTAGMPAPAPEFAAGAGAWYADTEALYTGTLEGVRFAAGHTQHAGVRDFARQVEQDYTAAHQRLGPLVQRHGVTAMPGETARGLERGFQQTHEALRGFEGDEFDRRWLDHQIAMNRWLLDSIDRSYMPAVRGRPDLEQELTTIRGTVQRHLQEAERIRGTL
jgi:putative membrane protein